jgi:hypothetical protein
VRAHHAPCGLCPQLVLDPHVVVLALPPHILACLLGHLSGVLPDGHNWAAQLGLTEADLTDAGPLEHVTRGAAVLVALLEVIPRFRCACVCVCVPLCTRVRGRAMLGQSLDCDVAHISHHHHHHHHHHHPPRAAARLPLRAASHTCRAGAFTRWCRTRPPLCT